MDPVLPADMKAMLAAPDPLDGIAGALERMGAWRSWTLERQTWWLRKRFEVSQAELSRRSGVSQRRISRIEAGADLKLSTLRALWGALGVEPLVIPDTLDFPREGRRPRRQKTRSGTSDLSQTT